jgi:hypothetical protein
MTGDPLLFIVVNVIVGATISLIVTNVRRK